MNTYENEINLAKFLTRYLFLIGEDLKKLNHEDVKVLFPDIKRTTFEQLKRKPDLLYTGKVVLVNDGHKTIPYCIPDDVSFAGDYTNFTIEEVKKEEGSDNHYDYVSMSNYELKKLLNSKFGTRSNKKKARKELEDRGVIMKKEHKKESKYREDYYEY